MARGALSRIGEALALACLAGLAALVAPPLALLLLAVMVARLVLAEAPTLRQVRFYEIAIPVLAAFAVGSTLGLAAGVGMVFVWRVIADARWSWMESARLAAIAGAEHGPLARAHLWLTPLFGLAMVAYTAPHMVAGLPLDLPHVPAWVPIACGAFAGLAVFDWLIRLAADWRLGQFNGAVAAHDAAHHAIFLLAYAAAQDVSAGLVALIAWRMAHAMRAQASLTAVP